MLLLTEDAVIVCAHPNGVVKLAHSQSFVRVHGRRVLVDPDPEHRPITGCANAAPPMRPCLKTLKVQSGYSDFVRIGRHRVCLDSVVGFTDGMPPGTVQYTVRKPGQAFVRAVA